MVKNQKLEKLIIGEKFCLGTSEKVVDNGIIGIKL